MLRDVEWFGEKRWMRVKEAAAAVASGGLQMNARLDVDGRGACHVSLAYSTFELIGSTCQSLIRRSS